VTDKILISEVVHFNITLLNKLLGIYQAVK